MTPQLIEQGIVAFATFFATIGPVDVAAIYAGLTAATPPIQRRRMAVKGVAIATGILVLFALVGHDVLNYMGITLAALQTAGGILLLLVGINLVLAEHSGVSSTTDEENAEAMDRADLSVFPLATPLIAGPGTIGAAILLMAGAEGDLARQGAVLAALVTVLVICLVLLLIATQVQRVLGVTGLNVISRVIGVLLTALAVQFIFNGLQNSGLFV